MSVMEIVCIAVCILVGSFFIFVFFLGIFHLILKCFGKTTRECLKKKKVEDCRDEIVGDKITFGNY